MAGLLDRLAWWWLRRRDNATRDAIKQLTNASWGSDYIVAAVLAGGMDSFDPPPPVPGGASAAEQSPTNFDG